MIGARWFLVFLPAVVFSCTPLPFERGKISRSELITEDEIEASLGATAYEVIQRLRPTFLSYRGETSFDKSKSQPYPRVYIDGQELGPISTLRTIPALEIATIRLYRAWDATTKFGTGNMGGVIAITTRQ